jgi:hypothetical protein
MVKRQNNDIMKKLIDKDSKEKDKRMNYPITP